MSGIVGGNLGRGSGLVKAGAIDDNAVTLAKMAGLARGKLIYGDTSGDPAALDVGGADEVLTHDGTDFDWAAAGGGAVTAINNATANELVTIGSTTTELDAESGLTYTDGALVIGGTTPSLTIGDAGAEDTKIVFDGNAQDFHIGLDDTADDLVIGLGSTLGTTTHMSFDEAGHITKPLQSAFLAFPYSAQSNVASGSTLEIDGEVFDQNADYDTTTYTFTAPVTGKYHFSANITFVDFNYQHGYFKFHLMTSNYEMVIDFWDVDKIWNAAGNNGQKFGGAILCDMDAADTAYLKIELSGTASTDMTSGQYYGQFSGHLVC